MNSETINTMLQVINAIDQDRALSDDSDNHIYVTLVDNNRSIKNDLKPLKSLIKTMEEDGLIETDDHFGDREYMKLLGSNYPVPFVYIYEVTKKGRMFETTHRKKLREWKNKNKYQLDHCTYQFFLIEFKFCFIFELN